MNARSTGLSFACGVAICLATASTASAQCYDCGVGYPHDVASYGCTGGYCAGGFGGCASALGGCCLDGCGRCGKLAAIKAHFQARRACREARRACRKARRACRKNRCDNGCIDGGCVSGSHYGYEHGDVAGEQIIEGQTYEPEAIGSPILIDEQDHPAADDSTGIDHRAGSFTQLASHRKQAAADSPELRRALADVYQGDYHNALYRLSEAVERGSQDPLTRYLLALCQYQIGDTETAAATLREAVRLEGENPIINWGRRMQRIQGRPRLWIEQARRDAEVVR